MRVLVICARRYNGHELWPLLGTLQEKGHSFVVVSTAHTIKDERTKEPNSIERLVYDVQPRDLNAFDGLTVVSGNTADTEVYWDDKHVEALLKEARNQGKVISAICCAVPTLAPVVQGVKVSYFPLIRCRRILEQAGALLQNVSLTVDQRARTITAEHEMMTQMWAEEIDQALNNRPPLYQFTDSKFRPQGKERRMPKEVRKMIDKAKQDQNLDS